MQQGFHLSDPSMEKARYDHDQSFPSNSHSLLYTDSRVTKTERERQADDWCLKKYCGVDNLNA